MPEKSIPNAISKISNKESFLSRRRINCNQKPITLNVDLILKLLIY